MCASLQQQTSGHTLHTSNGYMQEGKERQPGETYNHKNSNNNLSVTYSAFSESLAHPAGCIPIKLMFAFHIYCIFIVFKRPDEISTTNYIIIHTIIIIHLKNNDGRKSGNKSFCFSEYIFILQQLLVGLLYSKGITLYSTFLCTLFPHRPLKLILISYYNTN